MRLLLQLFIIISVSLYPQSIVINEIMPANYSSVTDEDGEYSDWLEIFNNTDASIDLSGYGISDDPVDLFKWVMPSYVIDSREHLLLFASDKNRNIPPLKWETVIDWGDYWKYLPGTSEPPSAWKNLDYNDSLWQSGKSGFGFGDNDDSTVVSQLLSLYVRCSFDVDDTSKIDAAVLHVDYDDAFVAYLNGIEIARANIGTAGIPPAYNESALEFIEPLIVNGSKPITFELKNYLTLLRPGRNTLAIQVHNFGTNSSDLTLIPFLSLGYNTAPLLASESNPLLDLPKQNLHTNFKISKDGETLLISDPQGNIVDQVFIESSSLDISYGRQPDGNTSWFYFSQPTPGAPNISTAYTGIAGEPVFSLPGGVFTTEINININPSDSVNIIRYTTDGSEPTVASPQYSTAITITSPKVIRAREFGPNLIPGKIITNSYLINFSSKLPVFSLVTDPKNFFDNDHGIYVLGDSAEASEPRYGANFWEDWERPLHIELFDDDGGSLRMDAGVKIFGAYSRTYPQKSLAIYGRQQYGFSNIKYKLFRDLPFTEYESFLLRNSGNDWYYALMRDALVASLTEGTGVDKQAYRPAVVFLNGQYWGIHDLREKINEHFISAHHNVDEDSIDILENLGSVVYGSNTDYMNLYNFISSYNLSVQPNYDYVKARIDIDNFINYSLIQIYCGNRDWPGNNIKYWRKSGNGKWRWILYDADFGFGLYESQGYTHNTLNLATEVNGPNWPNPAWSTLILRKLLENTSFKNEFINRYADFSNTRFSLQNVNKKIFQIKSAIELEIPRHALRWNIFNLSGWNNNVQQIYNFANNRLTFMNTHFLQKFSLPGMKAVSISINDTSMGAVKLNSLTISTPSWSGSYFMSIPINITAAPKRGYKFVAWEGSVNSNAASLVITLNDIINLKAVFQVDENFSIPDIVINEINYNSSLTFNPDDWIEFYNNSDSAVDLSGWRFMDEEEIHSFIFPAGTLLNAGTFIVVCRDSVLFSSCFPEVNNFYGGMGFGLSGGGELLRLYDEEMYIIDSLTYDDKSPWPADTDGKGPTLALINPDLDNSNYESWTTSLGYGTPGKKNDIFSASDEHNKGIPEDFSLSQNYPNPFNPVTKIKFTLPVTQKVTIKIYNILGKEISTLINDEYIPGTYEIDFTGSQLSSGVYFYRIIAGSFTQVRKMQILK